MKTSNIILISLIGSISFVIVAGLLQLRLTGTTDGSSVYSERKIIDVPFTDFKYLVISETTNLQIIEGSQPGLAVSVGKDDPDPTVKHHQVGDTLFIDKLEFGNEGRTLTGTLKVNPATLKSITVTDSHFSIHDVGVNNLEVNLNNSHFYVHATAMTKFGNISINAADESDFSTNNIELDTVNVQLENSNAYFGAMVNRLNGVLKNSSTLSAPDAGEMEIRKDRTSRIN